jgi:hypothetical protein
MDFHYDPVNHIRIVWLVLYCYIFHDFLFNMKNSFLKWALSAGWWWRWYRWIRRCSPGTDPSHRRYIIGFDWMVTFYQRIQENFQSLAVRGPFAIYCMINIIFLIVAIYIPLIIIIIGLLFCHIRSGSFEIDGKPMLTS